MFAYLKEVINADGGMPSSRRFIMITSSLFMGIGMVVLTIAACLGRDVADAIWAFTVPLSLMAGASYSSVEISKIRNPAIQITDERLNNSKEEE